MDNELLNDAFRLKYITLRKDFDIYSSCTQLYAIISTLGSNPESKKQDYDEALRIADSFFFNFKDKALRNYVRNRLGVYEKIGKDGVRTIELKQSSRESMQKGSALNESKSIFLIKQ